MNIGMQIKLLRKQAKLTQPELAEKVGVHETTIRRWEQGKDGGPDIAMINKLADVFHITPEQLLSYTENSNEDIKEKNINNNIVVLSLGGDKSVRAPATPEGYDFLERLFLASLKAATA